MADTTDAESLKQIAQNIQNVLIEIKENFDKTVSEQTNLGDANKKFDQIFNKLSGKLDNEFLVREQYKTLQKYKRASLLWLKHQNLLHEAR